MLSCCTSPTSLSAPLHLELWLFASAVALGFLLPLAHFDWSSCLYFPFYAYLFIPSMNSVPGSSGQLLCCGALMLSSNPHSIFLRHPCVVGRVRPSLAPLYSLPTASHTMKGRGGPSCLPLLHCFLHGPSFSSLPAFPSDCQFRFLECCLSHQTS